MSEAYKRALVLAENAVHVFPSGNIWAGGPNGSETLATTERGMLDSLNFVSPNAIWLARSGSIVFLSTRNERDLRYLSHDFGPLPETLAVKRATGGAVYWFWCAPDADIQLGKDINGTHARFRSAGIIPGSIHAKSGERYEILGGDLFDLNRLAQLPQSWIDGAPKNSQGVTANLVQRAEYTRPRPSDW